jgi:hypothetical protein
MSEPQFEKGCIIIKNHEGEEYVLMESVWNHIVEENSRKYYISHFDKIIETINTPDRILQSEKDIDVVYYEKKFTDFYVLDNAVIGRVYNYVLINIYDKKVLTVYYNPRQQNKKVLWPKK